MELRLHRWCNFEGIHKFVKKQNLLSLLGAVYMYMHNTRPHPCTQSRKQGEWGGWVHPPRWATLGFWVRLTVTVTQNANVLLLSKIVYRLFIAIVCCVSHCCSEGVLWEMGSKRNKSNHKYFILFVLCVQVVIANYILQHNPYQKVEIMNITALCTYTHAHRLLNTR